MVGSFEVLACSLSMMRTMLKRVGALFCINIMISASSWSARVTWLVDFAKTVVGQEEDAFLARYMVRLLSLIVERFAAAVDAESFFLIDSRCHHSTTW